ncbi:3-phosphoglycerate dehydrogenase [Pseudoxanthomonas sp. SGD-10]|nr:3-phosphoglycerate dehydrogenase [Pseudoxanthomonas sp. SGD-10]
MKILANDGIDPIGKKLLEDAGIEVDTQNIPQEELASRLNEYDAITVRSATKVRKELIDACPNIKLIGRGGVGMDNIDVEYARSKGIFVENTPAASSLSVAELVFAHLFTGVRFLYDANREMPVNGATQFNALKKKYAKGVELKGKTIGIIGFGRIGKETAKVALGLGMNVLAFDLFDVPATLTLELSGNVKVDVPVQKVTLDELLAQSDFISLHIPFTEKPVLGKEEFEKVKPGVGIVNCSRGGTIDEPALIEALDSGKVAFAGLDVFDNEPTPNAAILSHPKISLTPHIGAATNEAQERIGVELAQIIIERLKG